MTRKKQADRREIFNLWMCCDAVLNPGQAEAHLNDVHGIPSPIRGKMRIVKTLDAQDWFQTNYEWTIAQTMGKDIVLLQKVRLSRK